MNYIIILTMVVFGFVILINGCGVWGIMMGIGGGMMGLFVTSNTSLVWVGLVILAVGVFGLINSITKSPGGHKQIGNYTKQIRKDEQEYGIIDFTDKK